MTHLIHFVVFLIPFANDRPLFLLVSFQSYQLKRVSYLLLQYFFFLTPGFSLYQCLSVSVCLFLLCTGPCREVPVGAGGGAVWGSPGSNPAAGCMYLIRKETTTFIITSSTVKVLMNLLFVWIYSIYQVNHAGMQRHTGFGLKLFWVFEWQFCFSFSHIICYTRRV